MKRAILFDKDGKAYGADSAEADGSAGWEFVASRAGGVNRAGLGCSDCLP